MRKVFALICLLAFAPAGKAAAGTLGMVADLATGSVTVFDADTEVLLGSVFLGDRLLVGDCSVDMERKLGFVTDFQGRIWVIDLSASPPRLAAGINPIPVSNPGEDTSISRDGRFLVVCDGEVLAPVSVVDIEARQEVHRLAVGSTCNSVEVCGDGSVLVTSSLDHTVRRLELDATGHLSDTGEAGSLQSPVNLACVPGAATALTIGNELRSFSMPGLVPLDVVNTASPDSAMSVVVSPEGDRIYLRLVRASGGSLQVFPYDPQAGAIGYPPTHTLPLAYAYIFYGIDQLALHPSGDKLFVPNDSELRVYDTDTWAFHALDGPAIILPSGVCVGAFQSLQVDIDVRPGSPVNSLNPRSKGIIQVAILASADLDPSAVDVGTVAFGPAGAGAVGKGKRRDVDHDGDLDLVLDFRLPAGISCGDTTVTLRGETLDGTNFEGTDAIRTVGCPAH